MKRIIVALFLFIFSTAAPAQTNPAHTRISIITCGPGNELYSLFGHTAIRIIDSVAHTDIVYNWGGFTFDQPNFYLRFLRGKLLYYSSADNFFDFMQEYIYEQRSVYEQVLDIDSATKGRVIAAIDLNMRSDNRYYKYDFLLDNCTTRVKGIVFENIEGITIQTKLVPENTTARNLIHFYLDRGNKPWTKLGIDILLGSRVDWLVSNFDAMFLPEFFMKGLGEAQLPHAPLVNKTNLLLQGATMPNTSGRFVPLIVLSGISILLFFISKQKAAWAKKITAFTDALLLYVTGLIGVLLLFMWFATDHTVCKNNFNLAWALPFNLPAALFLFKKPGWLSNYFFIAAVITAICIATWFFIPQQMNVALLPVVIYLLNRYVNLTGKYSGRLNAKNY